MAFAAIACNNAALAPAEPSTTPLAAPGISITISNVTDNTFDVKVAPDGEAAYYSYLVTPQSFAPDSSALYSASYSGIIKGAVKYDKEKPYFETTVKGLDPNVEYFVYAVAASKEGNVGKVVSKSTKTSDGGIPTINAAARSGNIVQVQFTENISYVEGKEVSAVVYAKNYRGAKDAPVIAKTVAEVAVSGAVAQFTFPEITVPGSWYLVNFPAGSFVDSAGNPCPALASSWVYNDEGAVAQVNGVYGYLANKNFDFEVKAPATLASYNQFINVTSPQMLNGGNAGKAVAKIVNVTDGVTTTTEYPLTAGKHYGVTTLYTAGFMLPVEPGRGDDFTFIVEEEAFEDIYGNKSNAFEIGPVLYSYGYTVDDVCGIYINSGESAYGSARNESAWSFKVAKSDDATKGNVVISNYYGLDCKIYAQWDGDAGILTVEDNDAAINGVLSEDGKTVSFYYLATYYGWVYSKADNRPLQLYMTEQGKFTDGNDFVGYYYEQYNWPASGKVADIDTEKDYLGYKLNLFMPEFGPGVASTAAVQGVKMYLPCPGIGAKGKVSFEKIAE